MPRCPPAYKKVNMTAVAAEGWKDERKEGRKEEELRKETEVIKE